MVKVNGTVFTPEGTIGFKTTFWLNPRMVATVQEMENKKSIIQMATGLALLVDSKEAEDLTKQAAAKPEPEK